MFVGLAAGLTARAMGSVVFRSLSGCAPSRCTVSGRGRRRGDGTPGIDLKQIAERIGGVMLRRSSRLDPVQIRRDLLGAGYYTLTLEAYLGYRMLATATLSVLLAVMAISAPSIFSFLSFGLGVTLAWRMPLIIVQRRAAARYEQIDRDLPELIDLLVVSVEAGVGLGGALQMIAARMTGPLGDELRLMLQEQSMGLSNDQSLGKMLDRCETPVG